MGSVEAGQSLAEFAFGIPERSKVVSSMIERRSVGNRNTPCTQVVNGPREEDRFHNSKTGTDRQELTIRSHLRREGRHGTPYNHGTTNIHPWPWNSRGQKLEDAAIELQGKIVAVQAYWLLQVCAMMYL